MHTGTPSGTRLKSDLITEGSGSVMLEDKDYTAALGGFTPAALRDVALHRPGELGWEAVGGLSQVKSVLLETLLWPSKVIRHFPCTLFPLITL